MWKRPVLLGAAVSVVLVMMGTLPAGSLRAPAREPEADALALLAGNATPSAGEPRLDNFTLVGHHDLGGYPRDYGDLWANGDFAYVGTRCGKRATGGFGVKVVDISDPANPVLASTLETPAYSRAEDVVVHDVSTPSFTGSLAVVGLQVCFGSGFENRTRTGLMFFDVTDGYHPTRLGVWTIEGNAAGCHEIDFVQRADGMVLVGCARNLIDNFYGATGVELIDATDPSAPAFVTNYTLDVSPFDGVGCIPYSWAHSARFENQGVTMLVSNWDAGTVIVDVSNPSSPIEVSVTPILPTDDDGDNHSAIHARGGQWLIVNPEDFSPAFCPEEPGLEGFGEVWVFDSSDPAEPVFLGTFATRNSQSDRNDALFPVHNTEVWSEAPDSAVQFMSSWYSDGIVWWQMAMDGTATQLGQFVPARQGTPPAVWGVYPIPDRNLVLASDFVTGLWIVSPDE